MTPANIRRALETATFLALAAVSLFPLALLLRHAHAAGLVLTGADGPFPADQLQYMAWIRQFGTQLFAANNLDIRPSHHVFFHPMFLLSGVAWRAGVSLQLAFLLWKPVAVLALFFGFRAYAYRFLNETWSRTSALAAGLFFAAPAAATLWWGALGSPTQRSQLLNVMGELLPATLQWGYLPAAIAVGLMPVFLLGVERLLSGDLPIAGAPGVRWPLVWVSACGAVVSWLHPWQGETLLVILVGVVAAGRLSRRFLVLLMPTIALSAPLAYYFVLSRADASWRYSSHQLEGTGHFALWAVVVALLPLAIPACAGLRRRGYGVGEQMLRLWPLATALVYLVLSPSFAQHAVEGLSLPLAIFAVRGLSRLRRPVVCATLVALALTVPGTVYLFGLMRDNIHAGGQPSYGAFFVTHAEEDALRYLGGIGTAGGVLPTPHLGSLVPVDSGRQTWLAHVSWTRDFAARVTAADALFDGQMPRAQALQLVRASGAAFVLVDCEHRTAPIDALVPVVSRIRSFGCATVYRVVDRARAPVSGQTP